MARIGRLSSDDEFARELLREELRDRRWRRHRSQLLTGLLIGGAIVGGAQASALGHFIRRLVEAAGTQLGF